MRFFLLLMQSTIMSTCSEININLVLLSNVNTHLSNYKLKLLAIIKVSDEIKLHVLSQSSEFYNEFLQTGLLKSVYIWVIFMHLLSLC